MWQAHWEQPVDRCKRSFEIRFESVARQLRDRDHHKAVLLAEPHEVRDARHGAVGVDDLADDAGGVEAREAGKIDCRLGLAAALQHAAWPGAQREDVSRSREVVCTTAWVNGGPDRLRTIVR